MHGLWWILLRLVVDFWCGAKALLPMMRPVMILHGHLFGCLSVSAHRYAVDQTAHECQEAKNEEYYTQYPMRKEQNYNTAQYFQHSTHKDDIIGRY